MVVDFNHEQEKYIKTDKSDLKSPSNKQDQNQDHWDGEWGDAKKDNLEELEVLLLKKKL